MSRLPLVRDEDVAPDVRKIFDGFIRERGHVPNVFRLWAHAPDVVTSLVAHYKALMEGGGVPRTIKQLVLLHVSRLNGCRY